MADGTTSFQRLQDIWSDWNIAQTEDASSAQKKALEKLAPWLASADEDPRVAVRAVQVLLLDPARPDGMKRAATRELIRPLSEVWTSAATGGSQSLWALQAMLLASWPDDAGLLLNVAQLLRSSFELPLRGRKVQAPQLTAWLASINSTPLSKVPYLSTSLAEALKEATTAQASFKANAADAAAHVAAHEKVQAFLQQVTTSAETILASCNQVVAEHELLFWGQAKYSHITRKPFRDLDADSQLWLAAREAASRSVTLSAEPAAAFLNEVLLSLGQSTREARTLESWMHSLHATIARPDHDQRIGSTLSAIVEDDALGLPVTFVRMSGKRPWESQRAAESVAIELDVVLERGQWATWIMRELLLDLRLERSP